MESIEIWTYPNSGSSKVEEQCWVKVNTGEPTVTIDGEYFCTDCNSHSHQLKLKENNAN